MKRNTLENGSPGLVYDTDLALGRRLGRGSAGTRW